MLLHLHFNGTHSGRKMCYFFEKNLQNILLCNFRLFDFQLQFYKYDPFIEKINRTKEISHESIIKLFT